MSLAAERTYLAYLRTGLAMTAAGVAVAGALPHAGASALRRGVGVALVLAALTMFVIARQRWLAVERAMRRGEPLPRAVPAQLLAWVLVVVAAAAVVIVLAV